MFWKRTRHMEILARRNFSTVPEPVGTGYGILFDEAVVTAGFSEMRLWTHLFVSNHTAIPVTPNTRLVLRFMHCFGQSESLDYEQRILTSSAASYINGYASVPIIGNLTRILCHPENLPPGPYDLYVDAYLVR